MKRKLLLLIIFMLSLGYWGWGQYSGTGTFTKITSLSDLTDGYYVIAYGTTFAMNNTNSSNYFGNTAITPSSNTLTNPATTIVWKIQTNTTYGGRTIYSEASTKYVSYSGSSNTAYAVSSVTGGSECWTFAWSTSIFTVTNVTSATRLLQYNTGSPRFACYTGSQQNITLYKLTSPTINVTGIFSTFTTTVGTSSASQSVAVSGSNLTSSIEVAALSGYEYSTDNSNWSSSLSLASSFSGNVYVRLTGASIGTYTGNVSFTSTGATQVDKAVSGTVNSLDPVINITGTFSAFTTTVGTPSVSQNVAVSGSNLTANIDVSAVTGYEYSTTNAAPWTSTLSLASSFSGNIYVRLTGASIGTYTGNVSFTSTGATQVDKAVSGSVTAPPPVITVTGTFSTFTTTVGTPSTSQNVVVLGSNLTSTIEVLALSGYEYSTTDAAPWTSTLSLASTFNGNIYVRLTGVATGSYGGNVSFTSTDATQVNKAVSGTVNCAAASFPFYDDFDYTVGTLLTSNCWAAHSGVGTNSVTVAASSITYPGYLSSGIGNEVTLTTSGEDVNRTFTAQISGTVYFSFLVNVTSATTTGDYFFNVGQTPIGTNYKGRVFVKADASNKLAFGIAQSTNNANYTEFNYDLNTTCLVVLKYIIVDGGTNDVASIFINPALNADEPSSGWITNTDAAGTDLTEVGSVALRQGSASNAPVLKLDGIRVSTTWTDIVGQLPTFTGTGNWTETARWNTGIVPDASANVIIDGTATISTAVEVAGLKINSARSLTIASTGSLTVSGALTNNGTLILQSPDDNGAPGSLITNGTVSGNVIAERYIGAYTTATDGWHLVSSPVNGAVIGNFSPGTNDDFYKYSETENLWENWKVSSFDFTNGEGYLCSYQSAATKSFTGVPNNADVSFSNMSLTSTRGWHLLGNPFPCSIKWNDGNWTLSNVNPTAKVLNSGGSYTDVTANGIIPAMQGFFVEVTNSTNKIIIPKAARVTDAPLWYKDVQANKLKLTAQSDNNNTYAETVVRFDPEATTGFDEMFDSHFLSGIYGAPQFYSIVGNEKLSSNVFPVSGEAPTIPLGFVKGNADSYTLSASGIETFANGQSAILEDLKAGIQQKLNDNPIYSFTSATGDDANRFILKFSGAFGINEPSANPFSIYSNNGIIYVNNSENQTLKGTVTVYSVTGQAITTRSLTGDRLQKFSFNGKPGCYIVKVTTDKGVYSQKIIL